MGRRLGTYHITALLILKKPEKRRVVFDAAAMFNGVSLNKELLVGPDLLNSVFGVLQRFRMGFIAIVADIEAMFHQVKVPERDSDALRFLWKENWKDDKPPDVYKMTAYIWSHRFPMLCKLCITKTNTG